jgi:DNA-binding MarR family transcriptional regulator
VLARAGPLTDRKLAKRLSLAHPSIAALIDRLEKKRFVRRTEHPIDGRSILVELRPESLKRMAGYFEGLRAASNGRDGGTLKQERQGATRIRGGSP